jgi:hypothetical protein
MRLLVASSVAMLALIGMASSAQADPATTVTGVSAQTNVAAAADSGGHFAPYPGTSVTPQAESGVITAGTCRYRQAIDDPHGPTSGDASVHGWWLFVSGPCPSKATVTAYLQAYWCDIFGCSWITVDSSKADVYAGGGSGKRATARQPCASNATVGWRGYVDVDLDNWHDPSGYTYSSIKNLACSPP